MNTLNNLFLTVPKMASDDYVGFTFFVGCMAMMAASAFFFLSMNNFDKKWRTSILVSGLITFIAAVHYYYMRDYYSAGQAAAGCPGALDRQSGPADHSVVLRLSSPVGTAFWRSRLFFCIAGAGAFACPNSGINSFLSINSCRSAKFAGHFCRFARQIFPGEWLPRQALPGEKRQPNQGRPH